MEVKIATQKGVSALSFKTDFNEVLDKNFAAICDAIATRGIVLKELLKLFEEQGDEFLETIWFAPGNGRSKKEAEQFLSEELKISQVTAIYLLETSIEDLSSFSVKKLKKTLDEYRTNINKMTI